jgi:hypothetical protein
MKKAILILTALMSLITVSCSVSKATSGPGGHKVNQISTSTFATDRYVEIYVYALCDDGTLWVNRSGNPMNGGAAKWTQVQTP